MPSATAYCSVCLFFFSLCLYVKSCACREWRNEVFLFLVRCVRLVMPAVLQRLPATKSHDKSCTSSLVCHWKTAAACPMCVCACVRVLLFFFVVYWDLNRACCFPVMFGQPCCVYCAFNLCCCSFNLLNFSHDKSACHRDFLTCELRSLWWQMEKFVSSLLVFAKKTFRDG